MAHSLEARVPFLDYRLVELLFSLGSAELIERGRTKAVLRRALGDLLPPVVRDRVDKLGFVTPGGRVAAERPRRARRGRVRVAATSASAASSNAAAARRSLERHRSGERSAGFELWRALCVELWAREFL